MHVESHNCDPMQDYFTCIITSQEQNDGNVVSLTNPMMNLDLEEDSSSSFNSFNTTISDKLGMVYHWQVGLLGLPWFNGDPHDEKT